MRFRLGCFSIRRTHVADSVVLFANPYIEGINPDDYQNPLDRYRNGKPIVRISGPVAKNTIPIEQINEDFVKNPRRRQAIAEKFNTSGGLNLDTKTRTPRTPRKTKTKPSRARTRKPVRVQRTNGSTFIRIQNVAMPEPTTPKNISTAARRTSGGRAALMSLAGVAGVAGAMYLVENATRKGNRE